MCLICIEFDKLSLVEIKRNLGEMKDVPAQHAADVIRRAEKEKKDEDSSRCQKHGLKLWQNEFGDWVCDSCVIW